MRRAATVLAALGCAACAVGRAPAFENSFSVHAGPGFEDQAAEMAALARAWSPVVAERLRVEPRAPLSVWLQATLDGHLRGLTTSELIAIVPSDERHFTLVHELVHWHSYGTAWERLPQIVEEGLCDIVSAEGLGIGPGLAKAFVPLLPEAFARAPELLRLSNDAYRASPEERQHLARALGWYLARHHGIDGLHDLVHACHSEAEVRAKLATTPLDVATVEHLPEAPRLPGSFPVPDFLVPRPSARALIVAWRSAQGELLSLSSVSDDHAEPVPIPAGATHFVLHSVAEGD